MAKSFHGFDEEKRRINPFAVIEIIIIVVCAALIVLMLTCYFLFSKTGAAPEIFGKTVYVTTATNMSPSIPEGSAVFASAKEVDKIAVGDVALFRIADGSSESNAVTGILRVQKIEYDEAGQLYYTLKGDANGATEIIRVPKENIIAKCKSYDSVMGAIILFTTSTMGLLTVVVIPCLLLIVFQIVRIVRIKLDSDDDEFDEDDFENAEIFTDFSKKNLEIELEDDEISIRKSPARKATAPRQTEVPRRSVRQVEDEIPARPARTAVQSEEPPAKKLYIDNEGNAKYRKSELPTSSTDEFRQSVHRDRPLGYDGEIPSFRSRTATASKPKAYSESASNDDIITLAEAASPHKRIQPEYSEPGHYEIPKAPERPVSHTEEPTIKSYYTRTSASEKLAPPVVENPVDITIPEAAVKPTETIAPPPKTTSNKTVEELMRMIDNAK